MNENETTIVETTNEQAIETAQSQEQAPEKKKKQKKEKSADVLSQEHIERCKQLCIMRPALAPIIAILTDEQVKTMFKQVSAEYRASSIDIVCASSAYGALFTREQVNAMSSQQIDAMLAFCRSPRPAAKQRATTTTETRGATNETYTPRVGSNFDRVHAALDCETFKTLNEIMHDAQYHQSNAIRQHLNTRSNVYERDESTNVHRWRKKS